MLAIAMGLLVAALPAGDSVKADLNSPVYAVREKARGALRASFVPTDRTKWNGLEELLARANGKPAKEIAPTVSASFGVQIPLGDIAAPCTWRHRLDRDWVLVCTFDQGILTSARLLLQPPPVNGDPPPNYTGLWRVFLEDGSLKSSSYYIQGKPAGPLGDGTQDFKVPPHLDRDASQ